VYFHLDSNTHRDRVIKIAVLALLFAGLIAAATLIR
jgi:hypothetical protein